ncbi:MAG: HD domain-containing protein, partial [Lentisphaerae bacterium]|nr:HD domain-containing protein [Lentisphaerota bacterium]
DRLMPLLHNVATAGRSWREHGVTAAQVRARLHSDVEGGSRRLWAYADQAISAAEKQGYLAPPG